MPSGKRAKQQRRVAVPPPPKGAAGLGARRASPLVLAIAGGVIVIIVLAVVLGIVLSQSSNSSANTCGASPGGDGPAIGLPCGLPAVGNSARPGAEPAAADVAKMFKGIPQHGFVLGQPNAPVTLIEYIDLQCPVCQSFETTELQTLVDKYVKPGKMKIEMKAWNIIDANHPGTDDSLRGQKVTIAAANQNKAFDFAEVLYDNQGVEGSGWLTNATVANIAASVDGLNLSQLVTYANSSAAQQQLAAFDAAGNQVSQVVLNAGQQPGTPTLLLQKGSEKPKLYGVGYPTLTDLEAKIDALLK